MKSFVLNRHGSLVLQANLFAQLDFSVITSLAQFEAIVKRDMESKAPTGTGILESIEAGKYQSRIELLRDVALNLYWVNRNTLTLYQKRPMRWRDVPKNRSDLFMPVQVPWQDADRKIASMKSAFEGLPSSNPQAAASEEEIFNLLFEVVRYKRHHATYMPPIKPTISEFLANPDNLTTVLDRHDPNFPIFTEQDIVDVKEDLPELEAIHRWVMLLHNLYPWDRSRQRLARPEEIGDDDFVIVFEPRNREVLEFINRVKDAQASPPAAAPPRTSVEPKRPIRPYPPVIVRQKFTVMPRIEALAASPGEQVCTNEDVIRNELVADDGRGDQLQDRDRSAVLHEPSDRRDFTRRGAERSQAFGPSARRDRRPPVLLMHEHPPHSLGGDLALGRAWHLPDS